MLLSTKTEEVAFVAVDQEPEVIAQRQKVSKFASELGAAEAHFLQLNRLLNPPDRYTHQEIAQPSRMEFLEAEVELPQAKLNYRRHQVEHEREADALRELRSKFRKRLTVARALPWPSFRFMKSRSSSVVMSTARSWPKASWRCRACD